MNQVIVIPVLNPSHLLIQTLNEISANEALKAVPIVVVNDGSTENKDIFENAALRSPNVTLLHHDVNKGKGAAIKSAVKFVQENFPKAQAIVTADADFQHRANDISKLIADQREDIDLLIGSRHFNLANTPVRSYAGNQLTRFAVKAVTGNWLKDTQSGLRRYSKSIFEMMATTGYDRYEFEMEVILACFSAGKRVGVTEVATHYLENNKSSHFRPVYDSFRIYHVLLGRAVDRFFK